MSLIIENDINSMKISETHENQMADLEKKDKSDISKFQMYEEKLLEADKREEALLKRISEKDKIITKMTGVVEAYEKTIADTIADKENSISEYEKQIAEIRIDRDLNAEHLASLETTFSDLYAKYERTKTITETLKESEAALTAEKKKYADSLKMQEQYYEKMKTHAISQLEIANNKLSEITAAHNSEVTKLKALLKKEEISRASVSEQLNQKSIENEELVKICDELINGGSTS